MTNYTTQKSPLRNVRRARGIVAGAGWLLLATGIFFLLSEPHNYDLWAGELGVALFCRRIVQETHVD